MEPTRTATKRTLAALSYAIEGIAQGAGPDAVVVALFQRGPYFAPMVGTYETLAEQATVVVAFAGHGPHATGVAHVELTDDEALTGVWGVVLLGGTVGAYLHADDLLQLDVSDAPLEDRRRFQATWGFDRAGASTQALRILELLGDRVDPATARTITDAAMATSEEPPTVAESSLGQAALVLAARLDDTQASLDEVRRQLEDETEHATRDPLTGLVNREGMERWLGGSAFNGLLMPPLGVVMLDLDGFKAVNDHHGHDVGDEILRAVAERLTATTRAGDIVTRWGGDEFVVLCPGLEGAGLQQMAQRLVRSVSSTSVRGISVGASAGTQSTRRRPLPLEEADAAMYAAKRAGRRQVTESRTA
ncbi:MAG: sensor domain-containing diguanylate cyclase [Acidimicrobiales bacterium]